jgi:hypothetical protein
MQTAFGWRQLIKFASHLIDHIQIPFPHASQSLTFALEEPSATRRQVAIPPRKPDWPTLLRAARAHSVAAFVVAANRNPSTIDSVGAGQILILQLQQIGRLNGSWSFPGQWAVYRPSVPRSRDAPGLIFSVDFDP